MIRLTHEGDIARLTLDRPAARNAIPVEGWNSLAEHVAGIDARLLVIEGAGGAFCAGADLNEFRAMQGDAAAVARFRQAMRRGLEAIAALPIPVVASIDGPCYGAGVALALACDLRVAGPAARFAITPARIGIGYPQEDVARLVALVGPGQASRLLMTGASIDAEEALRIGLVEATGGLEALVDILLGNDGASHAMLKRAVRLAVAGVTQDETQDEAFDRLLASDAAAARLSARSPRPLPPSGG